MDSGLMTEIQFILAKYLLLFVLVMIAVKLIADIVDSVRDEKTRVIKALFWLHHSDIPTEEGREKLWEVFKKKHLP